MTFIAQLKPWFVEWLKLNIAMKNGKVEIADHKMCDQEEYWDERTKSWEKRKPKKTDKTKPSYEDSSTDESCPYY